jgi:hypothetical protein
VPDLRDHFRAIPRRGADSFAHVARTLALSIAEAEAVNREK